MTSSLQYIKVPSGVGSPNQGETSGFYLCAAYPDFDPDDKPTWVSRHEFSPTFTYAAGNTWPVAWKGQPKRKVRETIIDTEATEFAAVLKLTEMAAKQRRVSGEWMGHWAPTREDLTEAGQTLWDLFERTYPDAEIGILVTFET